MDKFARISLIEGYEREFISGLDILVVGAGAIGNELIKNLALFGVGGITLVDFDTIELHNLTRSIFFREDDVGLPKSKVVTARASEISKETNFQTKNGNFWTELTFKEMLKFDAIICAVDNFEARIRLNSLAQLTNKLLINTGIDHRFASVEIFPFNFSDDCACYECSIPHSVYEKISSRYSCGWIKKIYQENNVIPTTSITASTVAAIAVSQLFECLKTNNNNVSKILNLSTRVLLDTRELTTSKVNLTRKTSCPSPSHRDKEFKLTSASRDFHIHQNIFSEIGFELTNTYVEFSEPILLSTRKNQKIHQILFDLAENFDENVLMVDGERILDADISWGMTLDELNKNYGDKKIPCKYVTIIDDQLEFDLILEMN